MVNDKSWRGGLGLDSFSYAPSPDELRDGLTLQRAEEALGTFFKYEQEPAKNPSALPRTQEL